MEDQSPRLKHELDNINVLLPLYPLLLLGTFVVVFMTVLPSDRTIGTPGILLHNLVLLIQI